MKKAVFPALVLAMTMVAGQAWGAVLGSAHDMTIQAPSLNTFGACAACHIPHKAVGNRLWPAPIVGTNAARGDVGNLCTYCHDGTNGVVDEAKQFKVFKDTTEGALTHGLVKDNMPEGRGTLDPSLPYTADVAGDNIQCTSCHNVHEQLHATPASGQLAFLISDIDGLCARCHPSRQFESGVASTVEGAWGPNVGYNQTTPADGNPGSHPVGTDIIGDSDANSPIVDTVIGLVTYGASAAYNLGPKAIGGSQADLTTGMGCVTCHMVHGSDILDPVEDLLAVDQVSSPANGAGEPNNALCEACHQGPAPGAYAGGFFPNPGAGAGTHPVDNYYNAGTAWTIVPPASWPLGDGGDNGGVDLICETCHMPHPLAAMSNPNQPDPIVATNSHILRNTDNEICDNCHIGGSIAAHHPVGAGLMVAGTFVDANIGDQDEDMECSDCHNGQGAHNWTGEWRVGLDPDWVPTDNGRGSETEAARFVDGPRPSVSSATPTAPPGSPRPCRTWPASTRTRATPRTSSAPATFPPGTGAARRSTPTDCRTAPAATSSMTRGMTAATAVSVGLMRPARSLSASPATISSPTRTSATTRCFSRISRRASMKAGARSARAATATRGRRLVSRTR